jgi:hypothetical protein
MKITIHNVGRGAAVLVELPQRRIGARSVGIVDCYWGYQKENPLLDQLRRLRGEGDLSIEFVVITHMHGDHFVGVSDILDEFGSVIKRFYDPGLDPRQVILAEFYRDEEPDTQAMRDLRAIDKFKKLHPERVIALSAPEFPIYEEKAIGLTVKSVAPNGAMLSRMNKYLGEFYREMVKAQRSRDNDAARRARQKLRNYDLNRTSSAIMLSYRGKRVLLGGDVLRRAWELVLDGGTALASDAFLLSHHGSSDALPKKRWSSMLGKASHTIVSGFGHGQPSAGVLAFLKRSGANLWTTNIPNGLHHIDRSHDYVRQVHLGVRTAPQLKQGDVVCTVADDLEITGPRLF